MQSKSRFAPLEAARKFVHEQYPDCYAAILAGSVVRGEATSTSDLDIVIFDNHVLSAYRESHIAFDWPIEVFVHNLQSYKSFFESDVKRARPSLPRMVSEGVTIKEHEILPLIKTEATQLVDKGPDKWTEREIEMKRYFISDTLEDLIGSVDRGEELFIVNTLADLLHEFVLRTNGRWIGSSKWMARELRRFDADFTNRFVMAFDTFYKTGEKMLVIGLTDSILEPFGGRLFEGFSVK